MTPRNTTLLTPHAPRWSQGPWRNLKPSFHIYSPAGESRDIPRDPLHVQIHYPVQLQDSLKLIKFLDTSSLTKVCLSLIPVLIRISEQNYPGRGLGGGCVKWDSIVKIWFKSIPVPQIWAFGGGGRDTRGHRISLKCVSRVRSKRDSVEHEP